MNIKKIGLFLIMITVMLSIASMAEATTYTFQPTPPDIYDLSHENYYIWGIDWTVPAGETITGATLFFDDIQNWAVEENYLYVHLLDTADSGVNTYADSTGGFNDDLSGLGGTYLNTWSLTVNEQDIYYSFTTDQLNDLITYLTNDPNGFDIGFDPDCHYWNDGITLTLQTVPEPKTLLLLGSGLVGLAFFLRRRKK